jgi:recombinational DNA repair protein RecR
MEIDELRDENEPQVFAWYSPHVDGMTVTVYQTGWKKEWSEDEYLDLYTRYPKALEKCLEKVREIKKNLKNCKACEECEQTKNRVEEEKKMAKRAAVVHIEIDENGCPRSTYYGKSRLLLTGLIKTLAEILVESKRKGASMDRICTNVAEGLLKTCRELEAQEQ